MYSSPVVLPLYVKCGMCVCVEHMGVEHMGDVCLVCAIDSPEVWVRNVHAEAAHFCQMPTISGLGKYEGSKSSAGLGGKGVSPSLLLPHPKAIILVTLQG